MSQPAARFGDNCSGHDNFPPRAAVSASDNVFIDNIAALRVGDKYDTHTDNVSSHDGIIIGGSSSTFINGMASARVGDAIDCGSTINDGSTTTFIG